MPDRVRIEATFGSPGLRRLIDRLRDRYARGQRDPTGAITLPDATDAERQAVDSLLGRRPSQGRSLRIPLDRLDRVVRESRMAAGLFEAIQTLLGPIPDEAARQREHDAQWQALFERAAAAISEQPGLATWVRHLQASGHLKRVARREVALAEALLDQAIRVLARLPERGVTLARLAADVTGDAHALDRGTKLTSILTPALSHMANVSDVGNAARWRAAWDRLGVVCDALSTHALVLNLPADADHLVGETMTAHARAGEPLRLTARALMASPPRWLREPPPATVYLCENPSVVTAAADLGGSQTQPLICLEGQPSTAVGLLLSRLAEHGVGLAYHGDFDWPGIRIANTLMQRWPVQPWRMHAADYRTAATHASEPLTGQPADAG